MNIYNIVYRLKIAEIKIKWIDSASRGWYLTSNMVLKDDLVPKKRRVFSEGSIVVPVMEINQLNMNQLCEHTFIPARCFRIG